MGLFGNESKSSNLKMFSVFDSKAGFWNPPMCFRSRGEALRSFQTAANDKRTSVGLHPHDYSLHEIGEFDQELGQAIPFKTSENLGLAAQYVDSTQTVSN